MTIKLIFDITLTIIIIYIFFIYNVEHATDVSDTDKQITDAVRRIYLADVEAIRNLGAVAGKLNTGDKLDFPGQLNITKTLATNGLDPTIMPTGWTGGIRFIDGYSSGNMGFGPDGTTINAKIEKDGTITGKKLTFIDGYSSGNMVFGSNATTINAQIEKDGTITGNNLKLNGNITLTKGSIGFGTGTALNAQIKQNGDINGNNLILIGDINGNNLILTGDISGNNLVSQGNITSTNLISGNIISQDNISGGNITSTNLISGNIISQGNITGVNLIANNILTKRNKAQFIRVGNKMTTDIPNLDGSTNTDASPLAVDYWTLIRIMVISRGVNVAEGKPVSAIGSTTENKPYAADKFTTASYQNIISTASYTTISDNYKAGYHGDKGRHLLEIDLGGEYDIDAIELYNRYSSTYSNRMNGTIIELISSDKKTINRRIHTGSWNTIYYKFFLL
jgi:hypothetical protein